MEGQLVLGGMGMPMAPVIGLDGAWGTAEGCAVRESLAHGSLDGVMDVLDRLDAPALADVLREVGFPVAESAIERGRDAVLASVQSVLIEAVERHVDGYEVCADRPSRTLSRTTQTPAAGFGGNPAAVDVIQRVWASRSVEVDLLGDLVPAQRMSLQCIAAQAMEAGLLGFGFDGLAGKFKVPFGLHEVVALHEVAAASVAVESVREGIDSWRHGGRVGEMSRWVPDSVQRVLQGSLSEEAAQVLARSIDDGGVARYAGDAGAHTIAQTLAEKGLDINAPTIEMQAETLGLVIAQPSSRRDKYVGSVVGADHRAALVKYARGLAIEVPFTALGEDQERLNLGDMARIDIREGTMTIHVVGSELNQGVDR